MNKLEILRALAELPEEATIEDAIERLCFLSKIEKGLAQLDDGLSVSHDEVKRRFA
jgi:predicted transcriptional regulator